MTLTRLSMLDLGTTAPPFSLPDVVTGQSVSLDAFADRDALLVMFVCRHCPYVKHVQRELARIGVDYQPRGVGIVGISANDAEAYPDDAPPSLKEWAHVEGFGFPLLYDESQAVARAYSAACTPDFFVFDRDRRLVYRGQFDDTRPNGGKAATGADLRRALDQVLRGEAVAGDQKPSIGCNIKWRKGDAPGQA